MAIDLTATSAPPRRQNVGAPARTARATKSKTADREESLNGLGQLATFGLVVMKQYADAGAVGRHGPPLAREIAVMAETNDNIAKGIDYLDQVGPYAGLIAAAMPLVLQLLANHNLVKAEALAGAGVVHPDVLTAGVKADMARQAAEALRQQHEAEQELSNLHAEAARDAAEKATNGQEAKVGADA